MTDTLERKMGMALRAAHFQMQASDAKEVLSYMHEQVEELREIDPRPDLFNYYQRHQGIASFLRHLGFDEFDGEELRLTYNHIVNSVYRPEVADDPQPRTQTAIWKATEKKLEKELQAAKEWSDFLSKHDPHNHLTTVSDYVKNAASVANGAYFLEGRVDLSQSLHHISKLFRQITDSETFLQGLFEEKRWDLKARADRASEGLREYEKKMPTFFRAISMMSQYWFVAPIFSREDILPALRGDFAHLEKRVEEKQAYRNPGYLDTFAKVREELKELWGGGRVLTHPSDSPNPEELLLFVNVEQWAYYQRKDAVRKADAHLIYHLLQRVKNAHPIIEEAFLKYSALIKERHPTVVQSWLDAEKNISSKLEEASREKEAWNERWKINYEGVQRCERLKQEALNNSFINNTHPTFNTSAYAAKLMVLSAQLEMMQRGAQPGHYYPSTKLLLRK